jgi:hypothetical protein
MTNDPDFTDLKAVMKRYFEQRHGRPARDDEELAEYGNRLIAAWKRWQTSPPRNDETIQ